MNKQLYYRTLLLISIIVIAVLAITLSGCGASGEQDSDVWVLNGLIFPDCYDTSHMNEE